MSDQCGSCAFREGCDTHDKELYNRFRSQVAALSGLPFACHAGLNWKTPIGVVRGVVFDTEGHKRPYRVCEGWKAAVRAEMPRGRKNAVQRLIRRALGQSCFDLLDAAIGETGLPEKSELWAELRATYVKLLNASNLKIVRPKI